MSQTKSRPSRKAKKSFTLSIESVTFLEEMRKQNSAESISSILEEILLNVRRERRRLSLERATAAYYDGLSDKQVAENREWGEFAMRQFSEKEKG